MIEILNKGMVLIIFSFLLLGCTFAQDGKNKKDNLDNSMAKNHRLSELTIEQESAFDALNTLQMNSDDQYRLYSTFANHVQPCFPADTSIVITRSELLIAMKQFAKQYYTHLDKEESNRLINAAVMSQTEYTVLHCTDDSSNIKYTNGLPMRGTWVMPSILGRRDLILEW